MTSVLTPPRQTKLIPAEKESQSAFVARGNKELYRKIPDAMKRNRYILKCWREAGRDGELSRIAAERFPDNEFQTIHDLPIFPEHRTVGKDGKERVYDRQALETVVAACNRRILDTGDFAVLSGGHTPDDPTSAHARLPETLGYQGPFRLGMIGNLAPKWCIFTDEHQRRDRIEELKHLPRRSAEIWLEDNILDPVAAIGAETPRLDTGIVRNCRLPDGRMVMKYSALATSPAAMNTSPPAFGKKSSREMYAAGDSPMSFSNEPSADSMTALSGMPDEQIQAIAMATANILMQSKPMQWVASQMPQNWTPGEGEEDAVQTDGAGESAELGGDNPFEAEAAGAAPAFAAPTFGGAEPAAGDQTLPVGDIGAATAGQAAVSAPASPPVTVPADAATDSEFSEMDDEDKERYAAHDSAGRKGFLDAWRRHGRKQKEIYSAGGSPHMTTEHGHSEHYSRLTAENAANKTLIEQQQARIDQLEARNRHNERYSRLATLSREHNFDLKKKLEQVKDLPADQFDAVCTDIKENYSRRPVPLGEHSPKLPVEGPEMLEVEGDNAGQQKAEKYSRRASEFAKAAYQAGEYLPWDEAMAKAVAEIDGAATAK